MAKTVIRNVSRFAKTQTRVVKSTQTALAKKKTEKLLAETEKTTAVKSSNIKDVSYNRENKILSITFHKGNRVYSYYDVPFAVYAKLLKAPSKGEYLAAFIKPRYEYAETGPNKTRNGNKIKKGGSR